MRANELRIGNLLSFNNMITKEEIVKVNAWFLRQLVHDPDIENPQLTGYYQPIPLTEEWLEKFGFEEKEMTGLYAIYGGHLESSLLLSIRISKTGSIVRHPFIRGIKILHVHQLQNLYFALTGEELTLKSKVTKPNQN